MRLTPERKEELREELLRRNPLLDTFLAENPEYDHWALRTLFAEVKRDAMRDAVEAHEVPALDPQRLSKKAVEAVQAGWLRKLELHFDPLPDQEPRFSSEGRTWLVISDIHAPDQDDAALDVMFQIGRDLNPHGVIIDGDFFNCSSLSRFTPNAEQHLRWKDEQREALKVAVQVNQNFPGQRKIFIPGNHDVRPQKWIDSNALPLQGYFTLEEWLGIQDLGWELHDTFELAGGDLLIKHGTSVSQHAGQSVKKEVDRAGVSVIMGHCHRMGWIEITKYGYSLVGCELGCLANLRPDYANPEDVVNWQHGFAVVTEYEDDFDIELVRIKNGRAQFRGLRYESRV